ncbi:type IV pilus modification protein PilV [Rhodoferax sp.]|uniref:type IV pilus modification protein PilV n=1 Tax=Rhodoferax sp. TaxID=50421 RepID=UPI00374DA7B9
MSPRPRKHVPARCNDAGFAMIEMLVSLLLFSMGVLGMVAMQAKASTYAVDAEDRTRAAMLADEIVATMWAEKSAAPSTLTAWAARVQDSTASGLPNASSTVVTATATGITTVTISWKSPSKLSSSKNNQYITEVVIP